ncbi:riboflavin synthase subunit alpha [Flavisolibacter tropicus]|uniref:Riboflavin synthase n=2 Tax=Flavisolibacter tropicus TaxID=1492898 RepID=A0A172U2Z5_9BACT|nr:riboflavin synthase subunit alpha [Flavisolibacter tropicus]
MFTGIIEVLGQVKEVEINGTNKTFWIQSPLSSEFKVDQSIAHNGVCLTVEEIRGDSHRVTAVQETLEKTALNQWREGFFVNIERSLLPSSRLDGHFVQGHVDTIGICEKIEDKKGSWEFTFSFSENFAPLVIEKGSISLNGTSLTVYNVGKNTFSVAIIPYTYEHTILQYLKESEQVNLEFDMVGKYIVRNLSLKN